MIFVLCTLTNTKVGILYMGNSHTNASNKYNKANYQKFQANLKIDDAAMIDNYCNINKISKPQLIVGMFNYCVSNNVNLKEWIQIQDNIADK